MNNGRWTRTLWLVALAVGGAGCGGATSTTEAGGGRGGGSDCASYQLEVERHWNAETRAGLRARITRRDDEVGSAEGEVGWSESVVEQVTTQMDRTSEDWVRMREQLCLDREHDRIDAATYATRTECLDGWLRDLRAAIQVAEAEGTTEEQLSEAFSAVFDDDC